ncbi:peptidylprolyl isomerase [Candidatus Pacearchaeota archaeon]|nr:peptidylprolyl isomerase [Candidatus Pacearchaeota archaeon]
MIQKKDFIEVEFTGSTEDGEVFDSNKKDDLNYANLKSQAEPFVFCIGEGMFLKSVEDFLIGKDLGEYEIQLTPENAFGKRNPGLVKIIPMKIFRENKINPTPGFMFNFDGRLGKVLSVSGGRVITDFNNPVAGKNVIYKVKVLRKIENIEEKAKALTSFFFRRNLKFEIKDKKLILEIERELKQFAELFKDKFKEILDLELEVKEIEEKLEDSENHNNA